MIRHISIFLPYQSVFYLRIYRALAEAFEMFGVQVSGSCRLLESDEMINWIKEKKPCVIFEMNRTKNEIPVLYEFNIKHVSWIVDFMGRDENQIKGSDITYFFHPGWNKNYRVGGLQDWLPPGTDTKIFYPQKQNLKTEFSFVGHIPKPWSETELSRKILDKSGIPTRLTFERLMLEFSRYMETMTYKDQTHASLIEIIYNLSTRLVGEVVELPLSIRYDLMDRIKRMKNRERLLSFAISKSESIEIYGPENWNEWSFFRNYYKRYVDDSNELRSIYQAAKFNLHDGICFHFRAIDCMASGGLVMWFNDNYKTEDEDEYEDKCCGLHSFFEKNRHYIEFGCENFDAAYENANKLNYQSSHYVDEVVEIINSGHTWGHRAKKTLHDICLIA